MNLRKMVYFLLSFVNLFIPKSNKITIYGGNNLDDNSEAMFRYLLSNTDYSVICLADNLMEYPLRSGVKI
mgnify:CR=1 FL=1